MKYVHQPLNEEIRSIGGYYKVLEEGILELDEKKVLYVLLAAHTDTSCCGARGGAFISIPGYVSSWKSSTNEDGASVSEVKRVRDSDAQKQIKALLGKKYSYVLVIDFE